MTDYTDLPGIATPMLPTDDLALAWYDLSDRGNAERFLVRFGDRFRYVRNQGWFAFTGTHWARDGADDRALLAAHMTAAAILGEAKACFDAAARDIEKAKMLNARGAAVKEWATASGNISRSKGMLTAAAAKLACELDVFDADPLAINCANGTVRLYKDGAGRWQARLDDHDAADLISRFSPLAFDPDARAPAWEAHLKRVMPNIFERLFLQRTLGYAALGRRGEQCFFMWQGKGGDGKSVTSGIVRRVLGSYVFAADVKTFLEDKQGRSAAAASPDLARLAGATRIVTTSEPPRGSRLNEGLIKLATGGAPMTARHLNKDPFEFIPGFVLFIECNARPGISGSDDGIWRRIHILPWRVQIPAADMDRTLEDRIVMQEGAGVLAWIIDGALKYLERGIDPPDSIRAAHADYKRGSNAFREWLELWCELKPDHVETFKALHASYKDWMAEQGAEDHAVMSAKAFGLALSDHQIVTAPREGGSGAHRRRGVRLRLRPEMEAMAHKLDAEAGIGQAEAPASDADGWQGDD